MTTWGRWSRRLRERFADGVADGLRNRAGGDSGNAVVEFVFVALIVMVPLIYIIVLFSTVSRDQLAVTTAAREAGRAFATADTPAQGLTRAELAAQMAYDDAGLDRTVRLRFVAAAGDCDTVQVAPTLRAGAQFAVCVLDYDELPAVPLMFQGRHGLSSQGRFVVHIDDYR